MTDEDVIQESIPSRGGRLLRASAITLSVLVALMWIARAGSHGFIEDYLYEALFQPIWWIALILAYLAERQGARRALRSSGVLLLLGLMLGAVVWFGSPYLTYSSITDDEAIGYSRGDVLTAVQGVRVMNRVEPLLTDLTSNVTMATPEVWEYSAQPWPSTEAMINLSYMMETRLPARMLTDELASLESCVGNPLVGDSADKLLAVCEVKLAQLDCLKKRVDAIEMIKDGSVTTGKSTIRAAKQEYAELQIEYEELTKVVWVDTTSDD